MQKTVSGLIFSLLLFSTYANAGTIAPALPTRDSLACPSITNVTLFRCGCRLNVKSAGRNSNVSIPLQVGASTGANGGYVIFAPTDKSGSDCQGMVAGACDPAALKGTVAAGTYSCIAVTTTGSDGAGIEIAP